MTGAVVKVLTADGQAVEASTRTDHRGDYSVEVSRAGYVTVAVTTPRVLPRCTPKVILVRANQRTRVNISCDTGIR